MSEQIPEQQSERQVDFQINRDDLRETRFVAGSLASLAEDQVRLSVDRFALTANNISYAVAGDMLDYWGFFPGEGRFGRIPAMGFGEVVESRNSEVAVGTRYFGFYPMSTELVIDARPNAGGMVDAAAHRANHAPAYRTYNRTDADALYSKERENQIALLRGLFMTSFLVDDFLADNDFYGAETSIVTSASSKTSIALGFQLSARGRGPVVGLTSAGNEAFVRKLGCYDEVVLYEDIEKLDSERTAVVVDMAGNGDVLNRVHRLYGDRLRYSCTVGATHWEAKPRDAALPGPEPTFFFAPSQIQKRSKEWGPAAFQDKLGTAWTRFVDFSDSWLKISAGRGRADVERVYQEVLGGRAKPQDGHVLSL